MKLLGTSALKVELVVFCLEKKTASYDDRFHMKYSVKDDSKSTSYLLTQTSIGQTSVSNAGIIPFTVMESNNYKPS